jgi:hypothetical protein
VSVPVGLDDGKHPDAVAYQGPDLATVRPQGTQAHLGHRGSSFHLVHAVDSTRDQYQAVSALSPSTPLDTLLAGDRIVCVLRRE